MNLQEAARMAAPPRATEHHLNLRIAAGLVGTVVSAAFEIEAEALSGRARNALVATARQVAMYLVHTRLRLPYHLAGQAFGRDRTTASHACAKVEELRENFDFDALVARLEQAIDHWAGELPSVEQLP